MNKKLLFFTFFASIIFQNVYSQGCVINNYDGFNKVFITPTSSGARTFSPGNGNNFVRWEGTCGPHMYVETRSNADGTCTVTEASVTKTGSYYPIVSQPFAQACNAPLDNYIIWLMLILMPITCLYIRKRELKD